MRQNQANFEKDYETRFCSAGPEVGTGRWVKIAFSSQRPSLAYLEYAVSGSVLYNTLETKTF